LRAFNGIYLREIIKYGERERERERKREKERDGVY